MNAKNVTWSLITNKQSVRFNLYGFPVSTVSILRKTESSVSLLPPDRSEMSFISFVFISFFQSCFPSLCRFSEATYTVALGFGMPQYAMLPSCTVLCCRSNRATKDWIGRGLKLVLWTKVVIHGLVITDAFELFLLLLRLADRC